MGQCDDGATARSFFRACAMCWPHLPKNVGKTARNEKGRLMKTLSKAILPALALIGALCASPLAAGPDRYSVLLGSKHIGAAGYNEINPGFFATWERGKLGYSLGAFVNSYERGAVSGTIHLPFWHWEGGALGGFAGLAWYPEDGRRISTHIGGDVIGIGGLELRHRSLFLQFLPMQDGGAEGLVTFGVTWRAGEGLDF